MNEGIELLDVVAILRDKSDHGLVAGQVGTVVEKFSDEAFEVEFSDDDGRTYASVALRAEELISLHYGPVAA